MDIDEKTAKLYKNEQDIKYYQKINFFCFVWFVVIKNNKMCYNVKDLPITIRTRKDGDKILINNKLKNLSDYLTNQKVSHFVREALLVVTNNLNQVIYLIKKE